MTTEAKPPHGLAEITATYGDPASFFKPDGSFDALWWERHLKLEYLPFPYPLPLAYGPPGSVATHYRAHPKAAGAFVDTFRSIAYAGDWPLIHSLGGLFAFRTKRNDPTELSTHSWGIAIDLDPATNPQGQPPTLHPRIVGAFEKRGFDWGGKWGTPDGMHMQLCTGY